MSNSQSGRKRKASFSSDDSPTKKAKLAEGLLGDPDVYKIEFESGQIVRMALTNWVTFDSTEITCGPGLNLIVGPNGTGKSSVVCAICLGLGGKPKSLGRGDKASEFIKHGRTEAKIEIELFNKNKQNDIIIRYITDKGSSWVLNGKRTSAAKINAFVKEKRNIKVDNLCQFLAQDRVSEFARLSPKELLIETEKAVEDNQLHNWHKFLMDKGKEAHEELNQIENLQQTLRQNQAEIKTLQKTMEQFQQRQKWENDLQSHRALLVWRNATKKYRIFKKKEKQTLKLKKSYEKRKCNVAPLRKQQAQWNKKSQAANNKFQTSGTRCKKIDRKRMNSYKKLSDSAKRIKKYEDEIKQVVQDAKLRTKRIKKMKDSINTLQDKFADGFNEEDIEKAKQEKQSITSGQLKQLRTERNKIDRELKGINNQKQNIERNLQQIDGELESMKNVSKRRDAHIFNSHRGREKKFKEWVESNKHTFHGEVFGPIVKEMTVKNDLHAKYLNNFIGAGTFYGYVCQNAQDWSTLLHKSQDFNLQCTIYTSANDNDNNNNGNYRVRRPMDEETLRRSGVDGYLDCVFEAPAIIKKVLNDNARLHQRGYVMDKIDNNCLDSVLVTRKGESGRLRSLITPSAIYNIRESHYSNNILRSCDNVKDWGNRAILVKTQDFSQRIHAKQQQKNDLVQQLNNIQQSKQQLEFNKKQAVHEITKLADKKKILEDKIKAFTSLKTRIKKKIRDLQELENNDEDPEQTKQKLTVLIEKQNIGRVKTFQQLANEIESLTNLMKLNNAYSIIKRYCHEESKFIQTKIKDVSKRNIELRKEYDASKRKEVQLYREYEASIKSAMYKYPRKKFAPLWSEDDRKLNVEEIEGKINHLRGRINILLIDPERVKRYNRLLAKIESQSKELQDMENAQSENESAIKHIENQWKPKLLEAVEKISMKFGEFFAQFNKAQGKVVLVEAEFYCDWCIDILTKFRDDQPWKQLTASSQSGGEKSVSTMLYLLSLQQVTTVPFRVVDEINQGMDPINERRIMQILNYECTPKRKGVVRLPQYFVVTPKLLPKLKYSPCSTVYFIYNGPYQMPQKYWTPDEFVQTQKELIHSNHNNNNDDDDDDDESDDEDEDEDDEETEESD